MKTCLLSIFLLHGVHSLEAPLDGEDEGVRGLVIITIRMIITVIVIIRHHVVKIPGRWA